MENWKYTNRRQFLSGCGALWAASVLTPVTVNAARQPKLHTGLIPSSGERVPMLGMGTWITFNVGNNPQLRNARAAVLGAFFSAGGTFIDSSPMYGSAEQVLGYTLAKNPGFKPFAATKTWTSSQNEAREQLSDSLAFWQQFRFDLLQVHNLVGWQHHLPWLQELKQQGIIRYLGITTSHGRRHKEVEMILKSHPVDFVQLTYNLIDTEVLQTLIPLAREKGVAVICNRPFQGGRLATHAKQAPVPGWAGELGCSTWPQLLLKYVLATPGVTVAIPATSQVAHMQENMQAMYGELPDLKTQRAIKDAFRAI
ncbi:aldo/keto reductase [Planctobacterium marinum]|uniref:aldo/keto reductase n=1 Tax=Planctobacterium marinum TaxID=1631968 RepID=UPI001E3623F5|nr:aldo/keto reductase [Planctobacterium marinum]MCC2604408.1 aldo/keto reductase [Planctobacterium marinum]